MYRRDVSLRSHGKVGIVEAQLPAHLRVGEGRCFDLLPAVLHTLAPVYRLVARPHIVYGVALFSVGKLNLLYQLYTRKLGYSVAFEHRSALLQQCQDFVCRDFKPYIAGHGVYVYTVFIAGHRAPIALAEHDLRPTALHRFFDMHGHDVAHFRAGSREF